MQGRTENLIKLEDVHRGFFMGDEETRALNGVNLTIKSGEFVVILGPSGSGKTTLLNQIGGIDRPTSGKITVNNRDITGFSDRQLTKYRAKNIGWVFQFFNLIPSLNALENVGLGLELAGDYDHMDERALEMLRKVGLEEKAYRFPSQLSGGEQQRIALSRALVKKPQLIVADEPTGNLDRKIGLEVVSIMKELNQSEGVTFIIVTHDTSLADVADRVIHIIDGRIAKEIVNERALDLDQQRIEGKGKAWS